MCFLPSVEIDFPSRPNFSNVGLSTSNRRTPPRREYTWSIPERPSDNMRMSEPKALIYVLKKSPEMISWGFMLTFKKVRALASTVACNENAADAGSRISNVWE